MRSVQIAKGNNSFSLWENIKRHSYKGSASMKKSVSGAWNGWLEYAWICLLFLEYILSTPFLYNLLFKMSLFLCEILSMDQLTVDASCQE